MTWKAINKEMKQSRYTFLNFNYTKLFLLIRSSVSKQHV